MSQLALPGGARRGGAGRGGFMAAAPKLAKAAVGQAPREAGADRAALSRFQTPPRFAVRRTLPLAWSLPVAVAIGFIALAAAIQASVGAGATDWGTTNDEAAHFVNSLLVYDYVRAGWPTAPMAFARDYYAHFPRVSIGHWPPMFYIFQSAAFELGGRSHESAMALQAVIGGLAAGLPAALVMRRLGCAAGLATGLAVLASPTLLFLLSTDMLDNTLGLLVLLSALSWARFAERPGIVRAGVFAGCATAAILTKGNAFGLVLLPLFHAALSRRAGPLLTWQAWAAAAVVGALTLPGTSRPTACRPTASTTPSAGTTRDARWCSMPGPRSRTWAGSRLPGWSAPGCGRVAPALSGAPTRR